MIKKFFITSLFIAMTFMSTGIDAQPVTGTTGASSWYGGGNGPGNGGGHHHHRCHRCGGYHGGGHCVTPAPINTGLWILFVTGLAFGSYTYYKRNHEDR